MRILLADDHGLVRETIAAFLVSEGCKDVHCEGSLADAVAAFQSRGDFDLVLLDLNMPGMVGLDGLARMLKVAGNTPVAMISGVAKPETIEAAISAGAKGFLPKTMPARSISAAVRFMAAGEIYYPYNQMQTPDAPADQGLKPREREVLEGLAKGFSNKEIALNLNLQEVTVKLHVKTLSRKLNARNRTHAAMIARDNGLI